MALGLINGSVAKVVNALSPVAIAAAGSSNAVNYAGYDAGLLIATVGSAPTVTSGGALFSVLRGATSNGAFNGFGASLPGMGTNNRVAVRAFRTDTSNTWHKLFYDNSNGGSLIGNVEVVLFNARYEPVQSQESNVTTYSDVVRG